MDNRTAQQKILADIEERWNEVISEKHREQANILIWLVRQVKGERGEIPAEHHANIRGKIRLLSDALHRMTTNEAIDVSEAITIAEKCIPDPRLGTALRKPVGAEELAGIREKFPPIGLRCCSERWDREWRPGLPHTPSARAQVEGLNGNGTNGNGNGAHESGPADVAESLSSADTDTGDDGWLSSYNPLMGPQQKWVHRPRKGYMF